jgi:hypothetical protein
MTTAQGNGFPGFERRAGGRYGVNLELQYEAGDNGRPGVSGSGRAINISSGGILFDCEHAIQPGSKIRLKVAWPVALDGVIPLTLDINGRILRSSQKRVAVMITTAQFRTRSCQRFAAAAGGPAN